MKMAICEFLKFPSIPVKVTINEYLELAKEYSTPKSSMFINGILDNLVKEFNQEDKIKKTGRGLM
jgi:N utilization substance protein B